MNEEQLRKAHLAKPTTSKVLLVDPNEEKLQYAVDFSQEPNFCLKVTVKGAVNWFEATSLPQAFHMMKYIFDNTESSSDDIVGLYWLKAQEGSCLEVLLHRQDKP